MNAQQMMEEIDRLTRLCEAKDAQLEMQNEALKALMEWQVKNVKVWHNSAYDNAHYVLSATSETVAAWRAKETEPLRRQITELEDKLNK